MFRPAAIAVAFACAFSPAYADKPISAFCSIVKKEMETIKDPKAAEAKARADGVSEATIARAKQCLK